MNGTNESSRHRGRGRSTPLSSHHLIALLSPSPPASSVARTVKLNVPAVEAVPLMVPVLNSKSDRQGALLRQGTRQWAMYRRYWQPSAKRRSPSKPPGKEEVVMTRAGATAIDNALVVTAPLVTALSVTRTVKLNVPAADGVPLITPVPGASVIPHGERTCKRSTTYKGKFPRSGPASGSRPHLLYSPNKYVG